MLSYSCPLDMTLPPWLSSSPRRACDDVSDRYIGTIYSVAECRKWASLLRSQFSDHVPRLWWLEHFRRALRRDPVKPAAELVMPWTGRSPHCASAPNVPPAPSDCCCGAAQMDR